MSDTCRAHHTRILPAGSGSAVPGYQTARGRAVDYVPWIRAISSSRPFVKSEPGALPIPTGELLTIEPTAIDLVKTRPATFRITEDDVLVHRTVNQRPTARSGPPLTAP